MEVINKFIDKYRKELIKIGIILEIIIVPITIKMLFKKDLDTNTEYKVNKKRYAVYVRDNVTDDYVEYQGNELFPPSYMINVKKSHCEDGEGNSKTDALKIVDKHVSITSSTTLYCTLYFEESKAYALVYDPSKSGSKCHTVQCALDDLYTLLK